MTRIVVIDREGARSEIDAPVDSPLMYALRDSGLPVEGTCGGYAACGSCHIYVEGDWRQKLPPKEELEIDMLDLLASADQERSRLSCQIMVEEDLEGLVVELAPES